MAKLKNTVINGDLEIIGNLIYGGGSHDYIVEEVSTSSDTYIKFNSGKLIMYGNRDYTNVAINNRLNTSTYVYNSIQYIMTFPIKSTTPIYVMIHNYSNTGAYVSGSTGGNKLETLGFWFYSLVSISSSSHHVNYLAIGTWK